MKLYYLYSKKTQCEALYVCENEGYIDKPTDKTDVYPVGALLSKIVMLLTFWHKVKNDNKLSLSAIPIKKCDIAFSYAGLSNNDKIVYSILYMLLKDGTQLETEKKYDTVVKMLNVYLEFIDKCQQNSGFNNIDNLSMISGGLNHTLPALSVYNGNSTGINEDLMCNLISSHEILKDNTDSKVFNPTCRLKPKQLFKIEQEHNSIRDIESIVLTVPLFVYEIKDIADLVAISMKCIFEENSVIMRCKYCEEIFVTHKKHVRYCPNTIQDKGCGYTAKYQKQLYDERTNERRKIYKNTASMIASKFGSDSDEYNDFIFSGNTYRENIKSNLCSEADYITWMKEYWKKLKEKSKKEKQEAKNRLKSKQNNSLR